VVAAFDQIIAEENSQTTSKQLIFKLKLKAKPKATAAEPVAANPAEESSSFDLSQLTGDGAPSPTAEPLPSVEIPPGGLPMAKPFRLTSRSIAGTQAIDATTGTSATPTTVHADPHPVPTEEPPPPPATFKLVRKPLPPEPPPTTPQV
jgi:hypothetical protein